MSDKIVIESPVVMQEIKINDLDDKKPTNYEQHMENEEVASRRKRIMISRNHLNQIEYNEKYEMKRLKVHSILTSSKNYIMKYVRPTKQCGLKFIVDHLPIIELIRTYEMRVAIRDLIGGITIGAMQIAPSKNQ